MSTTEKKGLIWLISKGVQIALLIASIVTACFKVYQACSIILVVLIFVIFIDAHYIQKLITNEEKMEYLRNLIHKPNKD